MRALLAAAVAAAAWLAAPGLLAADGDVTVVVLGPSKKPLRDAAVCVGVKAWPGGKFRFTNHDATTDAKGRATVAAAVPGGTRFGVYAAVVEPGWTLTSAYVWSGAPAEVDPIQLTAAPATPLRLRFVDDAGKPVSGVRAAPATRSGADGVRHSVPGRSRDATAATSGADGKVALPFFAPGDWASVDVRFPGADSEQRFVLVPAAKDAVVDVPAKAPTTPDRELAAGGDARKRMFLTGPKAGDAEPAAGWGLVLVLPGGDGGDGFREWVRERYDAWVDAGWVWAELVAPKWDPSQTIVWPTTKSPPIPGMKFTTEEFVAAAVDEAAKTVKVDRARVVAVSWSSSGPACWRMLSMKDSPVTGHLIAMSVFHPQDLEPLANGKARPLHLLHSPEDDVCPVRLAEQGRDAAKKAGLDVGWATYEGGHGWGGESEDLARAALRWIASRLR